MFNRISGTTAISGAVDSSFLLAENRRGSGKAKLYCIGRDIEYREIELERGGDNIWQLVDDSRSHSVGKLLSALSAFMSLRAEYISTPTDFSNEIDPDGSIGITPKKAARQIAECSASLSQLGISSRIFRSNGRRLIEFKRAESVDLPCAKETVPFDPVEAESGRQLHIAKEQLQELRQRNDDTCLQLGLPVFQSQPQKDIKSMSNTEYHSAAKGESWKMQLMNTIDSCMRYAADRQQFLLLMRSEGYDVHWTDSRMRSFRHCICSFRRFSQNSLI